MDDVHVLEAARRELGLSVTELWWRYFALGGMMGSVETEAVLLGALHPMLFDRDLLALALNERFQELGRGHPIRYSDECGDG